MLLTPDQQKRAADDGCSRGVRLHLSISTLILVRQPKFFPLHQMRSWMILGQVKDTQRGA